MASRIAPHLTKSKFNQYCRVLGVPATASESKIKQAFYRKSFEVHPDRNKSKDSESAFAAVSEAYEALITHLKQGGGFDLETERGKSRDPVWKPSKQGQTVRKWSQTKYKYKTNEFASGGADSWKDFSNHSGAAFVEQTSAGDWCDDFYKKQLSDDHKRQMQKKRQVQLNKDNKKEGCVVM